MGFPSGSVAKNLPDNAGDAGLIPGPGRSPGEGNGHPLQYSCLGNPPGRLQSMGLQEWDTTEWLNNKHSELSVLLTLNQHPSLFPFYIVNSLVFHIFCVKWFKWKSKFYQICYNRENLKWGTDFNLTTLLLELIYPFLHVRAKTYVSECLLKHCL